MEALPGNGTAVQRVLGLLTNQPSLTAVTLYRQLTTGIAYITVRTIAHQRGPHPQDHYEWAIWVTSGAQAWDDTGAHAYPTAAAAYRAAMSAVQAVPMASGPLMHQVTAGDP